MTDEVVETSSDAPTVESTSTETVAAEQTLEQSAASSEVKTEAANPDTKPSDPEPKPTEFKHTSEKLDKLIKSKGGDPDKFVDGIHESWKSLAKLAKEFQDFKQSLSKPQVEAEDKSYEENEDYKYLKSKEASFESKLKKNEGLRNSILKQYHDLGTKHARLEGMKQASPAEKHSAIDAEISKIVDKVESLKSKWELTYDEDEKLQDAKRELNQKLKSLQDSFKQAKLAETERQKEEETHRVDWRKEFDSKVTSTLKDKGIPEERLEKASKKLNELAFAWLARQAMLGNNQAVLPETFIEEAAQDYADEFGYAKKQQFREISEQKKETLGKPSTPPTPGAPAKPSDPNQRPKFKNGAEAEAWIKAKWASMKI